METRCLERPDSWVTQTSGLAQTNKVKHIQSWTYSPGERVPSLQSQWGIKGKYLDFSSASRCFSMCLRVSNLDSGVNRQGLFQNAMSSSVSSGFFVLCSSPCVSGTWRWSSFSMEDGLGQRKQMQSPWAREWTQELPLKPGTSPVNIMSESDECPWEFTWTRLEEIIASAPGQTDPPPLCFNHRSVQSECTLAQCMQAVLGALETAEIPEPSPDLVHRTWGEPGETGGPHRVL